MSVRKALQIDQARVSFSAEFHETLRGITADVATGPGEDEGAGVEAGLYNLLLYEPGGHFVAHRDTEKEPGMFATLLICLPVVGGHQGGELLVRHGGEEVVWDTSGGDTAGAGIRYCTFFADCEHALSAVTSGLHLVLAYNLVRTEPMSSGGGGDGGGAQVEEVHKAVRAWAAEAASRDAIDGGKATNLLLRSLDLEHRYTEANLSFGGLKGKDAACVALLRRSGVLDLHLVLATKVRRGVAESSYGYGYGSKRRKEHRNRYRYRDSDDEEGEDDEGGWGDSSSEGSKTPEMGDIIEEDLTFEAWVPAPELEAGEGGFNYSALEDVVQESGLGGYKFFGDVPDEKEYEGYMGNAGPELTYVYQEDEKGEGGGGGAGNARLTAVRSAAVRTLSDVAALVVQPHVRCFGAGSHVHPMPLLELATSPAVLELAKELSTPSGGGGGPVEGLAASVVRSLACAQGIAGSNIVAAVAAAGAALPGPQLPGYQAAVEALVAAAVSRGQMQQCVGLATAAEAPLPLRAAALRAPQRRRRRSLLRCHMGFPLGLSGYSVCVLAGAVFGGGAEFREAALPLSAAVQAAGGLYLLGRGCAVREVVSLGTGADAGTAAGRAAASLLLLYARRTARAVAGGWPQFSWAMPAANVDSHMHMRV
ncbi:hypothetical protein FOA52_002898 [Chlamydomonas sp. UWO 241]|nr:hypothetical protein FOA52_002898 [Chlamydomonas sp. UWO 241]